MGTKSTIKQRFLDGRSAYAYETLVVLITVERGAGLGGEPVAMVDDRGPTQVYSAGVIQ